MIRPELKGNQALARGITGAVRLGKIEHLGNKIGPPSV
jgi:hypothetical protein